MQKTIFSQKLHSSFMNPENSQIIDAVLRRKKLFPKIMQITTHYIHLLKIKQIQIKRINFDKQAIVST